MNSPKETGRKLRIREKRRYTEEFGDEEIEGRRSFSVEEKLISTRFENSYVKEMNGEDVTLKYFQEHGFDVPIYVKNKNGLDMKMPDKSFTVNDVRQYVGNKRMLDVMDVSTQKDIEMSMKEWCRYYENTKRERLLNVISLEFSHTKLDPLVESPSIVRQIDWVDNVWPKHLKSLQTETTNALEDMKYPKVQKYCLMSVKGCYTDFHIDFGGTSVWYHILKGKKVFWLIPPSERNIQLYEQWVLSGKQSDIFFGDTVEQCARITLYSGYTFFIPTGWIHAVHTPEDSLVFGGNFLHSFAIEKQLRVAQVEDITKVPNKFRYPFYNEILWFVLQRFISCLSGKNHLNCNEDGTPLNENNSNQDLLKSKGITDIVHLTPFELNGLKAIVMWLSRLSNSKRSVPSLITNPEALLNDAKLLIDDHSTDDPKLACTGKPVLFWCSSKQKPLSSLTHIVTHSSPLSQTPVNNSQTSLSVTAQLRQIKHSSFSSFKQNNFKFNQSNDEVVKRPESPPTRPLSSNQYHVNLSKTLQDQIPSSFADLIAATDVNNQNRPVLKMDQSTESFIKNKFNTNSEIVSSVITNPSSNLTTKSIVNGITQTTINSKNPSSNDSSRRRRTRCKRCDSCLRADCGECHFCKDMKKFGGPGRMKQSCIARQCLAPVLPHTACCMICGRDGWEKVIAEDGSDEAHSTLMECSKCWEIAHPICLNEKGPLVNIEGIISDELPNSWECPKCILLGNQSLHTGSTTLLGLKRLPNVLNGVALSTKQPQIYNSVINVGVTKPANFSKIDNEMPTKKIKYETEKLLIDIDDRMESEESNESEDIKLSINTTDKNISNVLKSPTNSHVRSCARFPLLQEAIKQQQQDHKTTSFSSIKTPKINQDKSSVKIKKNNATCRDRLFKSLKGLKKCSEMMRFSNTSAPVNSIKKVITNRQNSNSNMNDSGCVSGSSSSSVSSNGTASPSFENHINESRNESDIEKEDESVIFDAETDNEDENDSGKTIITNNSINQLKNSNIKIESSFPSTSSSDDDLLIESQIKSVKKPIKRKEVQENNLKKPLYVVRPAPLPGDISETEEEDDDEDEEEESDDEDDDRSRNKTIKNYLKRLRKKRKPNLSLEKDVISPVLPYLSKNDLLNCMLVCKQWNSWCMDPYLWKSLDLTRKRINTVNLIGIIRRQPLDLKLSWSSISKKQLSWLIARLPRLQTLSLNGCPSTILSALITCNCPFIKTLDISWMDTLNDNVIRELLSSPTDSRPGLMETKTRLRLVTELKLSGSDISDLSIRLISHHLPSLSKIDLSNCNKITDMGIAVLATTKHSKLTSLKLSSCLNITDTSLESLKRCSQLKLIDIRDCDQVTISACHKFINSMNSVNKLIMKQSKLIEEKI